MRLARAGAAGLLCLAAASFGLAFFLPIYTDELIWKLLQGRMYLDGGASFILFPTCVGSGVPTPALLVPFRSFDSLLYERLAGPLALRVMGTALGLFGVLVTVLLLFLLRRGALSLSATILIVLSFATIGVMPFLIVMSRPEQILAIAIILLALPLVFDWKRAEHTLAADLLWGVLLLVLCSFVLGEHPRGLFAISLMVLFLFRAISRPALAVLTSSALVAVAVVALDNWTARAACGDAGLQQKFIEDNITFAASKGELWTYLEALLSNWASEPLRALFLAQFQLNESFTSGMIPPAGGRLAAFVRACTSAAFVCLLYAGIAAFLVGAARAWRRREAVVPILALASLWAFWAGSAAGRVQKNDYEATVMLPVVVLASLGSLWVARGAIQARIGAARWHVLCRAGLAALVGLSVVNQATLLWNYLPWARGPWTVPGYAARQRFSVVPFGYDRLRTEISETGALCGISAENKPHRLVVDELTYYEYWRSFEPVVSTYIDKRDWGRSIQDYRALLKSIGSEGMVVGCQWVPDELRQDAKQNGEFCCLPSFAGTG